MPNTLHEISNSRHLNRRFWNGEVRWTILLLRQTARDGETYPGSTRHLRRSLARKLEQRAGFEYLKPEANRERIPS